MKDFKILNRLDVSAMPIVELQIQVDIAVTDDPIDELVFWNISYNKVENSLFLSVEVAELMIKKLQEYIDYRT